MFRSRENDAALLDRRTGALAARTVANGLEADRQRASSAAISGSSYNAVAVRGAAERPPAGSATRPSRRRLGRSRWYRARCSFSACRAAMEPQDANGGEDSEEIGMKGWFATPLGQGVC